MLLSQTTRHGFTQRPLHILVAGEAVLLAAAVPSATGTGVVNALSFGSALIFWELVGSIGFGIGMVIVMHALGMHVFRARNSAVLVAVKYVACGALAITALWVLLSLSGLARPSLNRVVTAVTLSFAALALWQLALRTALDFSPVRLNVLVLGAGRKASLLWESVRRRSDRRGLHFAGFLPVATDNEVRVDRRRIVYSRAALPRICARNQIEEIVIAPDSEPEGQLMEELLECRFHGIPVTQAATFVERECGKIALELVRPDWWLQPDGFAGGKLRAIVKRSFDIVASLLLLLVAAPIMLVCTAAILLEDGPRASIFYRQVRTGLDGRPFGLIKFRSMREDAENDGVARWATENDTRVTRTGRILRKLRLDELPQLLNVLRGQMSLVGPRPERPCFVEQLAREIPYYDRRHVVKPGITGWAQLLYPYGASTRDAREKLKFDLYYIKNQSLGLDLAILLRTIEVVLFGKGAR